MLMKTILFTDKHYKDFQNNECVVYIQNLVVYKIMANNIIYFIIIIIMHMDV